MLSKNIIIWHWSCQRSVLAARRDNLDLIPAYSVFHEVATLSIGTCELVFEIPRFLPLHQKRVICRPMYVIRHIIFCRINKNWLDYNFYWSSLWFSLILVLLQVVALVCNFSGSHGSTVRLNHWEVETLFHEFGHALHSLLSRTVWCWYLTTKWRIITPFFFFNHNYLFIILVGLPTFFRY